jgi:hypothetical protein
MSYKKDLKKVMMLYPGLPIRSSDDYRHLINIHNAMETMFEDDLNPNMVKEAFLNKSKVKKLNSKNDYLFLALSTAAKNRGFNKVAYPTIDNRDITQSYDLDKWLGVVHDIYEDVERGKMDFDSAVTYHSRKLGSENDESSNFRRWLRYYNKGENKKYSTTEREKMDKKALFSLSPGGTGRYLDSAIDTSSFSGDSTRNPETVKNEVSSDSKRSDDFQKWVEGLHRTIRSLDNRLRKGHMQRYLKNDRTSELLTQLNDLSTQILRIENEKTAVDLAFKYANKFKKMGFDDGFSQLIKYAQDVGAPQPSVDSIPAPEAAATTPAPAPAATTPAPDQAAPAPTGEGAEAPTKAGTPLERALAPVTEAKEGEYESLAGDVGLGDAVSKLEDIAGRLSDRRTIRLLAEFDIILDKIGIAPMFPELAEAQSKLIDAYSYALTRVTKMLGMLSSGKSILEISESKKNELIGKTMKEVNRGIASGEAAAQAMAAEEVGEESETEKGPEATQEGLADAGLVTPAPTTPPAEQAAPTAEQPRV